MIGLEDRQAYAQDIRIAQEAGARLRLACETAGLDVRTLQRWKAQGGLFTSDRRPWAARPVPGHALSLAERAELLRVANEPRFAAVPPARIVPMLADEGSTWPASRPSPACCASMGRPPIAAEPRRLGRSGLPRPTSPRRRARSGAGT
jgi:hypothetical protein